MLLLLLLLLSLTMLDCFDLIDKPLIADKLCSMFTGCCFGVERSVIVDEEESVITPFSDIDILSFIISFVGVSPISIVTFLL